MSRLRDNVERWLVHENYEFQQVKSDDTSFKILIKNSDGLGNDTEVFEPEGQDNILVVGIKLALKTKQQIRFRELNEIEQENYKKKIDVIFVAMLPPDCIIYMVKCCKSLYIYIYIYIYSHI